MGGGGVGERWGQSRDFEEAVEMWWNGGEGAGGIAVFLWKGSEEAFEGMYEKTYVYINNKLQLMHNI